MPEILNALPPSDPVFQLVVPIGVPRSYAVSACLIMLTAHSTFLCSTVFA